MNQQIRIRRRGYCLTWNNYPDVFDPAIPDSCAALFNPDTMRYLIIGFEVAPDTGTRHLQMYVHYTQAKEVGYVIKRWPGSHVTPANGTPLQNHLYCIKGGIFLEFGTLPPEPGQAGGQKVKTDWGTVKELAMKGQIDEIDPRVYVQHYNTLHRISNDHQPPPPDLEHPCGTWFYGKPGTGKSYQCRLWAGDSRYDKLLSKWWNGYNNQETVIIDEVGPEHADWIGAFLKIWTDRYSFPAEVKGGVMNIRPKRVWITSNYRIETVFPGTRNTEIREAIQRRCPEVHFLTNEQYGSYIYERYTRQAEYTPRPYPNGNWFCRWFIEVPHTPSPIKVKVESSPFTTPQKDFIESLHSPLLNHLAAFPMKQPTICEGFIPCTSSDEELSIQENMIESPNAQFEKRDQLLSKYAKEIDNFIYRAPMKMLASPKRNQILEQNRARVLNFTDEEELRKILFESATSSEEEPLTQEDSSDLIKCDKCGDVIETCECSFY